MQGMKKLCAAVIAIAMLAAPVQAVAQAPMNEGYDDSSVKSVDPADPGDPADPVDPADAASSESSGSSATEEASGGDLPFTGTDVALLVAAGGGLLVLGFGVRRLTRRPNTA